jgi:hypothetical protein
VAIRIWRANKLSMHIGASSLIPVLLVIIESGAIYSATLTTLLCTYLTHSLAQYVLENAVREVFSTAGKRKSDRHSQISSNVVRAETCWGVRS